MSAPPVLLRGSLAQSPLPELLVRCLDENLAGTLVLQEPSGEKSAVLLVRGAPGKARLAKSPVYLGDVLVDLGILTAAACARCLEESRRDGRHLGQVLVSRGYADDTALYVALREQLHRQMLFLCDVPAETVFGLYQANYLSNWGASAEWRVKPLPLVWRALVEKGPLANVQLTVSQLGDQKLRMRFSAPVARYRLSKQEAALVNVLRAKPQSAAELLRCGVAPDEQVNRTLYALVRTRQLDLGAYLADPVGLSEPPESPQSMAPPPARSATSRSTAGLQSPRASTSAMSAVRPGESSPASSAGPSSTRGTPGAKKAARSAEDVAVFRAEVVARERLEKASYYEVLGIDVGADAATIRTAFFQLAKRWHPDRLGAELEDIREQVTRAFARMSEAHQVLSDMQQRAQYDQSIKNGETPEEQEQVLAVLRAAGAFQRAEVLMKKRDEAGALREARAAHEGDPDQAEYTALYVWLEARQRKENFDELVKLIDEAARKEPDNVRVRWYRGQLYKKLGREVHAMRDFRHIVELSPNHVEAQRELRVYEMRRKSSGESEAPGLFGRWRKK